MAGTRRTTKTRIELEVSQNEAKNRRQFKRIQQWAKQTKDQMDGIGRVAGRVAKIMGTAIAAIGGAALRAYGQMEKLQTSFVSMLKSGPKAVKLLAQLTKFAAKTPFQLLDIGAATKQLLAFGVTADDMIPTLETLGDIAAGAGIELSDMAQIYGKAMSKGKVQTEELNQMAERGIPIISALADHFKQYGHEISKADIYEMARKGLLSFELLDDVLKQLTTDSGIFADQMKLQSKTLLGLWSTVKDNAFNLLAEIGKQLEKTFSVKARMRDLIAWLQDMLTWVKANGEEVATLARWLVRGFGYAISVLVTSKLIGWLALVIKALYGIRTAAGAAALSARLMWGAFTFGVAFAVPFILQNWDKVVVTFWTTIKHIKEWWQGLMDKVTAGWNAAIKKFDDWNERMGIKKPRRKGEWGGGGATWDEPPATVKGTITKRFPQPEPEPEPEEIDPEGSWWQRIKGIWGGEGEEGEAGAGADLTEEERRLRSGVLSQEDLDKIVEDYKAAEEKRTEDAKEEGEKRKEAEKELHDAQHVAYKKHLDREWKAKIKHELLVSRIESAAAGTKIKLFQQVARVKAIIDKATALREMAMALAKDPAAAFARTYAQWGWPLGAIFGGIAMAATYASLIAGIASLRGMALGGTVTGGTPGRDSVMMGMTPGELVVPTGNFEEVVGAVAAGRDSDLAGGGEGGDELRVVVELDSEVLAEAVTEIQRRNRAI